MTLILAVHFSPLNLIVMNSVLQNHNLWIAACFAAYLGIIIVFATIYYSLYRSQPHRFLFVARVQETQLSTYTINTKRRIQSLAAEIEALAEIQDRIDKGANPQDLATQGIGGILPSGCQFALYLPQRAEWESVKQPTIELSDPDGHELSRVPLVAPWWGKRWDEVFLKRRYRNESNIALLEKRLHALQTDSFDIWSYWDFLYFSAICQTTVGFGDILPNATKVRLLVVSQVLLGYALLVVLLNIVFHP